jgi:hypothetical protein
MAFLRTFCCACALAVAACASDTPELGAGCSSHGIACDEGLVCFDTYPGGYCSQPCKTVGATSECPDGSVCGNLCPQGTRGGCGSVIVDALACLKICRVKQDCRLDLDCIAVGTAGTMVCQLPPPPVTP